MDQNSVKAYNAKILLFGEHLINLGSDALSIPYDKFSGRLLSAEASEIRLSSFIEFLKSSNFSFLDADKIAAYNPIKFSSSIPEGYGCGSSGAIVAACYDLFRSDKEEDLTLLKNRFAEMEAFFHGKSSGTDPLVSFFNKAIRFNRDGSIKLLPSFDISLRNYKLLLIDSGQAREGKNLIAWFLHQVKEHNFKTMLTEELVPATRSCIDSLLEKDETKFKENFASISRLQLEHFSKMIPDSIKPLWTAGLQSENLYLKLCGAGGGGFFIGLLKNDAAFELLKDYNTYSLI